MLLTLLWRWRYLALGLRNRLDSFYESHVPPPPTRRVRDAVGPSPAAARVERCVYITNPLMVRPNGSPAPATARQRGFQLPLLIKMFCNQSCANKHMDMLNLLLG